MKIIVSYESFVCTSFALHIIEKKYSFMCIYKEQSKRMRLLLTYFVFIWIHTKNFFDSLPVFIYLLFDGSNGIHGSRELIDLNRQLIMAENRSSLMSKGKNNN
jgi:hypothetical protein